MTMHFLLVFCVVAIANLFSMRGATKSTAGRLSLDILYERCLTFGQMEHIKIVGLFWMFLPHIFLYSTMSVCDQRFPFHFLSLDIFKCLF